MIKITERRWDGTTFTHETMSVKELIAALQTLDQDEPVFGSYDAGCCLGDIESVEKVKGGRGYEIVVG